MAGGDDTFHAPDRMASGVGRGACLLALRPTPFALLIPLIQPLLVERPISSQLLARLLAEPGPGAERTLLRLHVVAKALAAAERTQGEKDDHEQHDDRDNDDDGD